MFGGSSNARSLLLHVLPCLVVASCGGCPGNAPPVEVGDGDNAYICQCTCSLGILSQTKEGLPCFPEEFNENLGGTAPSEADLQAHCLNVLQPLINAAAQQCFSENASCECEAVNDTFFDEACNQPCVDEPLQSDCSNQDTANSIDGSEPVCQIPGQDPPIPVPDGLFRMMGSKTSTGVITAGSASISVDGDPPQTPWVTGTVTVNGRPCPGASCEVGIGFQLEVQDVTFSGGFLGLGDVTFSDLELSGSSEPDSALLSTGGSGTIPAGEIFVSGRGKAEEYVLGVRVDQDEAGFIFRTEDPVDVDVDWVGHTFTFSTSVYLPETADTPSIELDATLSGIIINEPPTADAGDVETLECTSPHGATVALDSTGSTDPEDNLSYASWHEGDPSGAELGTGDVVEVVQGVGTSATYHLTVIDENLQTHTDIVDVEVEDTTPPDIVEFLYDGPACLWAPNHKYVVLRLSRDFRVLLEDTCDPDPEFLITGATSNQPDNDLGDGDTVNDAVAYADHVCLRSERQGGEAGPRLYTVSMVARDASGNENDPVIQVAVMHDQDPGDRCAVHLDALEVVDEDDPLCRPVEIRDLWAPFDPQIVDRVPPPVPDTFPAAPAEEPVELRDTLGPPLLTNAGDCSAIDPTAPGAALLGTLLLGWRRRRRLPRITHQRGRGVPMLRSSISRGPLMPVVTTPRAVAALTDIVTEEANVERRETGEAPNLGSLLDETRRVATKLASD